MTGWYDRVLEGGVFNYEGKDNRDDSGNYCRLKGQTLVYLRADPGVDTLDLWKLCVWRGWGGLGTRWEKGFGVYLSEKKAEKYTCMYEGLKALAIEIKGGIIYYFIINNSLYEVSRVYQSPTVLYALQRELILHIRVHNYQSLWYHAKMWRITLFLHVGQMTCCTWSRQWLSTSFNLF